MKVAVSLDKRFLHIVSLHPAVYIWVVSLDKARGTEVMQDRSRGPLLESPDNFSGPESYFMSARSTLKIQIFLFCFFF